MGIALEFVDIFAAVTPTPETIRVTVDNEGGGGSTALVGAWVAAGAALVVALLSALTGHLARKDEKVRHKEELDQQERLHGEELQAQRTLHDEQLEVQAAQHRELWELEGQRFLTEQFGGAADQIGSDEPAVRLAGIYAMAALADKWEEQRQQCVDVLCAYMRLPPRGQAGEEQVRRTITDIMAQHLRAAESVQSRALVSWSALDFDLRDGRFSDNTDFRDAEFHGLAGFLDAKFDGKVFFDGASFTGALAQFDRATFGGAASFRSARFSGGALFSEATFAGAADFASAHFGGEPRFRRATFQKAASFHGGKVNSTADFSDAVFCREADFDGRTFAEGAKFSNATFVGTTSFKNAKFSGKQNLPAADFGGSTSREAIDLGVATLYGDCRSVQPPFGDQISMTLPSELLLQPGEPLRETICECRAESQLDPP